MKSELVKVGLPGSQVVVHAHGTRFSAPLGTGASEGLGRVVLESSEEPRYTSIIEGRQVEPSFTRWVEAEIGALRATSLVDGGIHAPRMCFERPRELCASTFEASEAGEWASAFTNIALSRCALE